MTEFAKHDDENTAVDTAVGTYSCGYYSCDNLQVYILREANSEERSIRKPVLATVSYDAVCTTQSLDEDFL